jgi:serine phosphatase RsbU (regulator of sigma subunit)/CHASE2 domain-containing sensor protein
MLGRRHFKPITTSIPRAAKSALAAHWQARAAALAVLAIFLVLQPTVGGTLLSNLRLALFDAYARLLPRELTGTPVIIVAVDEKSLKAMGQWPWPRQIIAKLIDKILNGNPLALGIDMVWPEPDRLSPQRWMQQEDLSPAIREELAKQPDHDALLRDALALGPVAIAVVPRSDNGPNQLGRTAMIVTAGGDPDMLPTALLPSLGTTLRSLPDLDNAARGHGLVYAEQDADGMVRRVPLVASAGNQIMPSLSLEMIRLATGWKMVTLGLEGRQLRDVTVSGYTVPIQADGSLWLHLTRTDPRRFVSAVDVLEGRVAADIFDQRLALLGITGLAIVDQHATPLGVMPGVEIHAQLLENILEQRIVQRPGWVHVTEPGLTAIFAFLLILLLPAVRLRWFFPVGLLTLVTLVALGFAAWAWRLWLVDVATPALGDALVFVALLGGSLAEADAQRRRLRRELEIQRLAAAKLEGELAAAHRVQMGMLPKATSLVPDPRFDMEAVLTPARDVGGDLYDFFPIDADRMFVAVGDVSGKGVDASLFMALGKALCKSCALRGETDVGAIVTRANAEISRENSEMMFITLFAGILDLSTGELQFANAGHDAPFIARPGQPPRQIESVGGPPLCSMDDFVYTTERHQLQPGELLILVTDGVTEATNRDGELMGHERTNAAIHGLPAGSSSAEAVTRLRYAVDCFLAGAELSDDLTLLAIRWLGPKSQAQDPAVLAQ